MMTKRRAKPAHVDPPLAKQVLATPRRPAAIGIGCPTCGCTDLRVLYTRPRQFLKRTPDGFVVVQGIMRKRACRHCGRQLVTHEEVVGGGRGGGLTAGDTG